MMAIRRASGELFVATKDEIIGAAKFHLRSYRAYLQYAPKRAPEVQAVMRCMLEHHDLPELREIAALMDV